jgi:hypothetical protein
MFPYFLLRLTPKKMSEKLNFFIESVLEENFNKHGFRSFLRKLVIV